MSAPLRILIVDDERAAQRNVMRLLSEIGGTEVVGQCEDGRSAVVAIERGGIDLVLLDVRMPELDGFGVVAEVGANRMPPVVFVTAFDDRALQAFDVNAVGYLLKPVQQERLAEVLRRVRSVRDAGAHEPQARRLERLLEVLGEGVVTRLAIKRDGRVTFVPTNTIDRIEASDVVARIHAAGKVFELRESLSALEKVLSPREFMRVHRSAIVRIDRVAEVQPWFRGNFVLVMRDGAKITTGRSYRVNVERLLRHG